MKKEKIQPFTGLGISSLLVIFAVLCLTVFALLSVSTVSAHQRIAQSSRDSAAGYYRADAEAEEILANLRQGIVTSGVTQTGNRYTFTCAISETQVLAVCAEVTGADYRILRWQAVSTAQWEAEEDLPVWDGEVTK